MAMKWLMVGIRNRELKSFNHETVTLDCEDADIVGHVFCENTWFGILSAYGTESFDAIMTDGGLMGVRRSETIVGSSLLYTSPSTRDVQESRIPSCC